MSSCFVTQLDLSLVDKLRNDLTEQGFEFFSPQYTIFSARKKDLSLTLYESGKLTVQGKKKDEFIQFYLEPEILGTFTQGYESQLVDKTARMGIDESGKGDFFGPLCIAGVFAEGEKIAELIKLGVKDSKKIGDKTILKMAAEIRKITLYHVVRINPLKYNELYEKFGNLNHLLAWGHATVIEHLYEETHCQKIIVDKFAHEYVVENALKRKKIQVALIQRTKAEEDVVVGAASILARAAFLDGLESLGQKAGVALPKGASKETVNVARQLLKKIGAESLKEFCKAHFKTYLEIQNYHENL